MNLLTIKKYTVKVAVILSLIFLLLAIFSPVDYTAQKDARKREYYPATVIDKYSYSSCSKSSCRDSHYVRVELENGWYDDVHVSEQTYMGTYVGATIKFERHITDPLILKQTGMVYFWLTLAALIWIITLLLKEWVDGKILHNKRKATIKANVAAYDKLEEKQ